MIRSSQGLGGVSSKNNPTEKTITIMRNMGGTEGTANQETSC